MASVMIPVASFLTGLLGMEAVAWGTHRYLMHGPLWAWHRSHHEPGGRGPELNDLFGLVFAGLALGLFWLGARPDLRPLWWAAMGATAYGLLYALVHDGLVHRRFPFPVTARRGYLLRLVQAHHLHHISQERDGAVSFGFLWAQDPERLRGQLRARRAT
ncbi:sterol desaturase family protein [Phenylobacterium sp.]|jgi:beta-carotene 3-hydroxylase|uniref:sterol desaturase family protein n=1 Tax=Phenylobacterium sp. TaxID=1871053 RepID=UPI002F933FF5